MNTTRTSGEFWADILEHAIDNGVNSTDYSVVEELSPASTHIYTAPDPCDILPHQFGYWFHTGPGFAALEGNTYRHLLLRAENVRVLGSDGVPVHRGDWVDTMSLNYSRTDRQGCQFRRENGRIFCRPVARRLQGRFFLGYNGGHNNYAHWLTDQVPLLHDFKTRFASDGVRLLMPRNHAAFVSAYLDLLRIPPNLIEWIGDEVVDIETLYYTSAFSFDAIPLSVIGMFKTFREGLPPPPRTPGKRIFVSREDTMTRVLLNERALVRSLVEKGFSIVVPGRLSVADQIDAFANADIVVGCHGAAMANIMFCPRGARIIEMFPEYTVSSHFWALASHFNLRYGAVFGTSFDQDQALRERGGSWDAPFIINEKSLDRCLNL